MIDTGLSGKVALVTGANHGIGAATARAFAAQGARVFIHYLRAAAPPDSSTVDVEEPGEALYGAQRAKGADELVQAILTMGGRAASWEANLSEADNIPVLYDKAEAALGPVDVLVNNAAHWEPDTFDTSEQAPIDHFARPISSVTVESHDRHFAVNSRAPALMMAEFGRRHIDRGATWGRIINVSTDGAAGAPSEVSYWASKYALESYSRAAARELGRYGITVNIVSPGPIQTGYIIREHEELLAKRTPLGRLGLPDDVADVMVFLASEQARWLTGQLLYVGGGHRMG